MTNRRTRCKVCTKIIYRGCIGCFGCKEWFHYGCANFSSEKEARDIGENFRCKTCKKTCKIKPKTKNQYSDALRCRHWLQRLVEYEKDFEDTKPNGWFDGNHITYLLKNIQQSIVEISEENQNFLYIKPIVVHWIKTKDSEGKDHASK